MASEIPPCSVSDSREKGRQPAVAEPAVAAGSTVVCKGVDFDEDQRTKQKRDRSRSRSRRRWAKLIKGADSDKEMKEGIHYEFTDWKPTTIRFARERRNPIRGMEFDNAITMRATKILVHVGKIRGSGRFAVAEDSR